MKSIRTNHGPRTPTPSSTPLTRCLGLTAVVNGGVLNSRVLPNRIFTSTMVESKKASRRYVHWREPP